MADLDNNDGPNNEIDVIREGIRGTVMGVAKKRIYVRRRQKTKPWFNEECLKLQEERKQAR